jgi:hypothetical protein
LVYWVYDTGGAAVTSPVLSRDGTQVAFVQAGGEYPSTLVLLKWAASTTDTIGSPMTLTRVGSESVVGASTISGSAPNPLYLGPFDSTHENSVNATGKL